MIHNLSTILFLIGIMILIFSHIKLIHSCNYTKRDVITMSIYLVVAIILVGVAWILREVRNNEKYKDFPLRTGKLLGGTVFASYPDNVPGSGWIM